MKKSEETLAKAANSRMRSNSGSVCNSPKRLRASPVKPSSGEIVTDRASCEEINRIRLQEESFSSSPPPPPPLTTIFQQEEEKSNHAGSCCPDEEDEGGEESSDSFQEWLNQLHSEGAPPREILSMLGLRIASDEPGEGGRSPPTDEELWQFIQSMGQELLQPSIRPRKKLLSVNLFQDVINLIEKASNIIVLTGAGISVSCGIPDFRSENGIYSRLGEYNLPNPQAMFDIDFFRSDPRPFFAFAKELFPKEEGFTFIPSKSHFFLKLLEDKGKLRRIYSQNIDMLESAAGLSEDKCILCHGSFATATCLACRHKYPASAIRREIVQQTVPLCSTCDDGNGVIKPDIVFFGESLPSTFHDALHNDLNQPIDLVLIIGSSLKVNPVRSIVGRIPADVPMVLINREVVGDPHEFDVELLGYCDEIVEEICRHLNWKIPLPKNEDYLASNLEENNETTGKQTDQEQTSPYTFVEPCRYLFNGACLDPSPDSDFEEDEEDEQVQQQVENDTSNEQLDDQMPLSEQQN